MATTNKTTRRKKPTGTEKPVRKKATSKSLETKFCSLVSSFAEDNKKTTARRMQELEEKRLFLKSQLVMITRQLISAKQKDTIAAKKAIEDKAAVELKNILALPKVDKVECTPTRIHIFTKTLFCHHDELDTTFEVGRMKIEINLTGRFADNVKWFNLDRKVMGLEEDMNAPHVSEDGTACLGPFSEIIPPLVAEFELCALVLVAIQFVESINTSDYSYREDIEWPEVK